MICSISFTEVISQTLQTPKSLPAQKIISPIELDGFLDDPIYQITAKADSFIQTQPIPGNTASFDSDVYFLYDNTSVYISARLYDPEPNKILKEFSLRDQTGNADLFKVFFDTYQSGLNGFLFVVTASGVQFDAIVSNNNEDTNWNAIWESKVRMTDYGWSVECKIPYSALRFPDTEIQNWRVQFGREIRRLREESYWNYIDPLISGWVQQSGIVTDITNIKSPTRLFLTPYVSTYLNSDYNPNISNNKFTNSVAYSAGLDLKYGINDAFTLDMTLVPDFGQVISDRQVLNLSPFEVFFQENRQFFTEGTELFARGNLFYSRRIGGTPFNYNLAYSNLAEGEEVIDNPETTQLINASKISGRTKNGTGIGFFNAIVGESFATIIDASGNERREKTNPITNYNAIVIDQNLPNNSFVSLMNTNVTRFGNTRDANATGIGFKFNTKEQKYSFVGDAAITQKYSNSDNIVGFNYNAAFGKISGNWTFEVGNGIESDKYDPNDLGYLASPNSNYFYGTGSFSQYKPKNQALQQFSYTLGSSYSRLYKPNVFDNYDITFSNFYLFKSRFAFGINSAIEPVITYDYFEPRTSDFSRFLSYPTNFTIGGFVSSDYRKPFAYDIRISYRDFNFDNRKTYRLFVDPRFRFSDRFSVFINNSISRFLEDPGYVNKLFSPFHERIKPEDILMGVRNRYVIDNAITSRFIFNELMGINLRIRHYWDNVRYKYFGILDKDGLIDFVDFGESSEEVTSVFNRNVNIFNIDLQYNWRFAPGSDMIFVWKNQIFNSDDSFQTSYFNNINNLLDGPQTNSFSVRILYSLDYLYIFPRKNT